MAYKILFSIPLLIIILYFIFKYFNQQRKKKIIESLRLSWGIPKETFYASELIQQYFYLKHNNDSTKVINDQICNDLDFQELYNFIDRTTSIVGQQYLYDYLRTRTINQDELLEFDNAVEFFLNNPDEREKAQIVLS